MSKSGGTTSIAAAAFMGVFAAYAATAQEAKNLPMDATAHFIYFPTGGHALDDKDQAQLKDVATMMQSTPSFVATIIGKADTVGSVDFNERLSRRRAEAVFESLVYDNKVPQNRLQMYWTGERLPFIATADETAESQNRMVAIIVSHATDAHFCGG
jgi:outer membrane protein OmpA-like peptidoglycan-associated protein